MKKVNWLQRVNVGMTVIGALGQEHSGRVFRLQFDEFQIVSSSHDDTILIWDFLSGPPMDGVGDAPRSPPTYTYPQSR